MELKDVVAVSGKSGLSKIVGKGPNGLVLESLVDKSRFITPLTQKVSILDDISVYTTDEDIKLRVVFANMDALKSEGMLGSIDKNTKPEAIKAFFATVLPDFDKERVYNSDILKIYQWFTQLHGMIDFSIVADEINADSEKTEKSSKINTAKLVKGADTAKSKTSSNKTQKGNAKTVTPRRMA